MARHPNTTTSGGPFDTATIEAVWRKGKPASGNPTTRKDACNASMERSKYGKAVRLGWEIDHIRPVSKGGTDALSNLQPLQWENNRHKGDGYPDWSCKVKH